MNATRLGSSRTIGDDAGLAGAAQAAHIGRRAARKSSGERATRILTRALSSPCATYSLRAGKCTRRGRISAGSRDRPVLGHLCSYGPGNSAIGAAARARCTSATRTRCARGRAGTWGTAAQHARRPGVAASASAAAAGGRAPPWWRALLATHHDAQGVSQCTRVCGAAWLGAGRAGCTVAPRATTSRPRCGAPLSATAFAKAVRRPSGRSQQATDMTTPTWALKALFGCQVGMVPVWWVMVLSLPTGRQARRPHTDHTIPRWNPDNIQGKIALVDVWIDYLTYLVRSPICPCPYLPLPGTKRAHDCA